MTDTCITGNSCGESFVSEPSEPSEPSDSNFSLGVQHPVKTVEEIQKMFFQYMNSSDPVPYVRIGSNTTIENYALLINGFIQSGETEPIYKFCDSFSSNVLEQILNAKPYDTYHGNVLHSTLYSNVGEIAKELYIFFRERGAIPCLDYYGEYPWEQSGTLWTCVPGQFYSRPIDKFTEIYQWAQTYEDIRRKIENYEAVCEKVNVVPIHNYSPTPCYCNYHHGQDFDYESDNELDSDSCTYSDTYSCSSFDY